MGKLSFQKIINRISTNFKQQAIPSLDGPLKPNTLLDSCPEVGGEIQEPDDVAVDKGGSFYVSTGNKVFSFSGEAYSVRKVIAEFDRLVTGLTCLPDGGLGICVSGTGVCFIGGERNGETVTTSDGEAINCPLSIATAADGTLYVTDGSRKFGPDKWVNDLMEKGDSGRLIKIDKGEATGQTMLNGLRWPFGVTLERKGLSLILTESWRHSVTRVLLKNNDQIEQEKVLNNLPGYPARIVTTANNGYWLSLFGLRTQLVDFVLNEDKFRNEMIRTIDPAFWIAPALKTTDHVLEPLQQAGIKSWGKRKAWAPPRSYGLIVRLNSELKPLESFHSRTDGVRHGITGLAPTEGGVLATSKGCNRILMLSNGEV